MKVNKKASQLIFAILALIILFVAATADYSSIEHSHQHDDEHDDEHGDEKEHND